MNNDLLFMYKNLESKANLCSNWKKLSITNLANMYCIASNHNNERLMEVYISALMCKYWYLIPYMYKKSKSLRIEITDIMPWLYEGLMLGFEYKRWRDPNYKVYKLKDGAKTVFNRCFDTIRQRYFTATNKNKSKVNYGNLMSVDCLFDEYGDLVESWNKNIDIESANFSKTISDNVIEYYLKNDKILSAIIVDGICNQNTTINRRVKNKGCYDKKMYHNVEILNDKKLIKFVSTIDDNFFNYFENTYKVDKNKLLKCTKYLKSLTYNKLTIKVEDTLEEIRNNQEVKLIVCC